MSTSKRSRPAAQPTGPAARPRRRAPKAPFIIGELEVMPGRTMAGEIEIPRLVTGTRVSLPLRVFHGRTAGPTVFVSSSVHGDEILGVEIIRRVAASLSARSLHGTVVFVPIVNVHGFLTGDRYLPDRRDLNRSFPGSANGSLASRIADAFLREVVARCDVGIDLHTGSDHRTNLPQVRCDLDDPFTRELADAFNPPVMLSSSLRKGSLRAEANQVGATILLYEGGEALRFDGTAITVGVGGIMRVLHHLGMTPAVDPPPPTGMIALDGATADRPLVATRSSWVRARRSGIGLLEVGLGDMVDKGQQMGLIHDSLGTRLSRITAPFAGLVIGHTQHPLVHQGSALVHLAAVDPSPPPPTDQSAVTETA
ncbi:MAG TPA: succinylglutamate desuccinylase/aspartoacylase family protein [Nitriliruptoraceae bacterium]|nr:succinylglutamate desuccinylase/aspartoacylase family protein [Nitriliruptoraceae bacterium]